MRLIVFLFLIYCMGSCHIIDNNNKVCNGNEMPKPVLFVLVDSTSGNNLIKNKTDVIEIKFSENNLPKTIPNAGLITLDYIKALYPFIVSDNANINSYSGRNGIKNFEIYLNYKKIGDLYIDTQYTGTCGNEYNYKSILFNGKIPQLYQVPNNPEFYIFKVK